MVFTESTGNVLLEKLNLSSHTISTIDSYNQMFTLAQNGDNNESLVEEGIARPRGLAPVTDVSDSDGHVRSTPDKQWCPKRRLMTRTSKRRITEGDDVAGDTDPRRLRFEEFKVSVEDAELMLVAAVQHLTPRMDVLYLESPCPEQSPLDQMTPQKVKHRRSKKRRRTPLNQMTPQKVKHQRSKKRRQ
jgi:hypothetical protein